MKVLFDHSDPFFLAHGGFQIQIEQTKSALEEIGVEVEYLRWWDARQDGELIHFFGRPAIAYLRYAHERGIKLVMAELLTGLGARSRPERSIQKLLIKLARRTLPGDFVARMAWDAYRLADACVALTPWEASLMSDVFGAPSRKVFVVPNGVEPIFLQRSKVPRNEWLVCTAVIAPRKRVLELAEAAVMAATPLWIIGKPYSANNEYSRRFEQFAHSHKQIIRYEGAIDERATLAQVYREARGFVLLSDRESLSLSALEAASCGCPLLLSDLPWARTVFRENARYVSLDYPAAKMAQEVSRFYSDAPNLPVPPPAKSWRQIAEELNRLYQSILKPSEQEPVSNDSLSH